MGNVHDAEGDSTVCHGCGEILVGRDWYVLGAWQLTQKELVTNVVRLVQGPLKRWLEAGGLKGSQSGYCKTLSCLFGGEDSCLENT